MAGPNDDRPAAVLGEARIERNETGWIAVVGAVVAGMFLLIAGTSFALSRHPPSDGHGIDPATLHLGGEFSEGNLGTTIEADGSATVRVLAEQYAFVPQCILVPARTPIRLRVTSADVMHGLQIQDTNVNTMAVPGYVAEVTTSFAEPGDHAMPCHEFCGVGHQGMWAHVHVVDKADWPKTDGASCDPHP